MPVRQITTQVIKTPLATRQCPDVRCQTQFRLDQRCLDLPSTFHHTVGQHCSVNAMGNCLKMPPKLRVTLYRRAPVDFGLWAMGGGDMTHHSERRLMEFDAQTHSRICPGLALVRPAVQWYEWDPVQQLQQLQQKKQLRAAMRVCRGQHNGAMCCGAHVRHVHVQLH